MKVCPVCKSRCFDDMDTCYGCMYRFDTKKSDSQQVREYAMSGGARENVEHAMSGATRDSSEYAMSGSSPTVRQNATARGKQQASEYVPPARWVQVPATKVELPPKPNVVPTFHEVEDNVNRYIMLEDVEQFLSRRLVEDDSSIVMDHPRPHLAGCIDGNTPQFAEPLSPQMNNACSSKAQKTTKRTLTLTLEIPQEAMSMLVC